MTARSGALALVTYRGHRRSYAACASCEKTRPLITRGLCDPCRHRCEADGTITRWGYVKADRLEDYAWLRRSGEPVPVAASRIGVSERTGWRYEAELRMTAPVSPGRAASNRASLDRSLKDRRAAA